MQKDYSSWSTRELIERIEQLQNCTARKIEVDAWGSFKECVCGNTPATGGFTPCDTTSKDAEPVEGWGGLYRCDDCGRLIDEYGFILKEVKQ